MTGPSSAPTTAGRPSSSTSREATSPTIPTGQGPRTIVAGASGGGAVSSRRRATASDARASPIACFVMSRRLRLAVSSSAASASASSASSASSSRAATSASPTRPAALIRGASANPIVSMSTAVAATPAEARSATIPGRGAGPEPLQAEPDDRPRLAEDRDEVGDAADRREVGQREGGRRAAGLVGEEQLGELERDAAARQAAFRIAAVGALRIDDRDRDRELRRDAVMVGDEHVDPDACASAISGRLVVPQSTVTMTVASGLARRGDGRTRQAVALVEPARDVRDRLDAEPPERDRQDREAGQPVRVEVAEDEDPLAGRSRPRDPCRERRRVRQEARVVERLERRREEVVEGRAIEQAAAREQARRPVRRDRDAPPLPGGRSRWRSRRGTASDSGVRSRRQDATTGFTVAAPGRRGRPPANRDGRDRARAPIRRPRVGSAARGSRPPGHAGGRPIPARRRGSARR